MRNLFFLLGLMLLTVPDKLYGQATVFGNSQKADRTLISIPVVVSDREGHYISGLKKEDFTIYQDGVKQKINFFETEQEPISVALLLDTSGSTENSLKKIKDAAQDFVELLNPTDKCMVATFDSRVNVLNSFTSSQPALKNSLAKVQTATQDGTLLHDAVELIVQKSFNNVQGRKVIVLLSDGKDFGSSLKKDELMNLLEESDVLIYSVFYQTGEGFSKLVIDSDGTVKEGKESKKPKKQKSQKKDKGYYIIVPGPTNVPTDEVITATERKADIAAVNSLQEMSDTTAGRFYQSDTPNLSRIFKKIAGELREQYRLGYHAQTSAGAAAVHNINVKVDRPDVVVRARGKFRAKQL